MDDSKLRKRPGAEPETLKIEGPWEDAVARALRAPSPPGGIPEKPSQGRTRKAPKK